MFTVRPQNESSELDKAIASALEQLDAVPAYSDEYSKIVNQITALHKLKEANRFQRVSPDTLTIVIGNLLGIVIIVAHERVNVITSKALNFVMKASR